MRLHVRCHLHVLCVSVCATEFDVYMNKKDKQHALTRCIL